MSALALGVVAFACFAVAHLLVWRLHRPRAQYAALAVLWLAVLVVCLSLGSRVLVQVDLPVPTAVDYLGFVMLYTALALPYFTTYSAVQADSPAMTILLRIDRAGARGLTAHELKQEMGERELIIPRLDDLLRGRLVTLDDGRYVIGPRGTWMAGVHTWFRGVLRMEKGG